MSLWHQTLRKAFLVSLPWQCDKSSCSSMQQVVGLFYFPHTFAFIWTCTKSIIHFKKFPMGFKPLETSVELPQFFTNEWNSKASLIESRAEENQVTLASKIACDLVKIINPFYYVYEDHKNYPHFHLFSFFFGNVGGLLIANFTHTWAKGKRGQVWSFIPRKKCFQPRTQNHDKNP